MRGKIIKLFTENLIEDVIDYTQEPSVADWDPRELAIEYGNSRLIGTIAGFQARKYVEDPQEAQSYVVIGLFDNRNIVAGIAYYYTNEPSKFGINRKVPVIEKVVVNKDNRGKGLSKELYLSVLKLEGIMFSDVTLFGPTARIWESYIPKIPSVVMYNFNDVTGEYSEFNIEEYKNSMDLRFVAVLSNIYKNIIKNSLKK